MKTNALNSSKLTKVFILSVSIILLSGLQKLSAQLFYANLEGSQVRISGTKSNVQLAPITTNFSCEGKFTMVNGALQNLSGLSFNLPLNEMDKEQSLINADLLPTAQPKNDINFSLTHSMVLPELNMIHAIGYLAIQGVKTRVDFHLDYIENNGEMITVMGKKAIKLSDYKKDPISIFADKKTQNIIQLDIKLVIKNPSKIAYIAKL